MLMGGSLLEWERDRVRSLLGLAGVRSERSPALRVFWMTGTAALTRTMALLATVVANSAEEGLSIRGRTA